MPRVCLIGAGPSGLSFLRAAAAARASGLPGASDLEIVCFEKQEEWGGLWNYSWRTGLDARGEPVHNSQYASLWSNGPKEALEMADYTFDDHFGGAIGSFPPREVLRDYIVGRAKATEGAREAVRFEHAVRRVSWDGAAGAFTVVVENLATRETAPHSFDFVVVASGHFSVPNVPTFPGLDAFPGRVLHAHDFRRATEFSGRDVLVVGGSYSAEDIALQCHKFGASSVTISYRSRAMGFDWPAGIDERPLLTGVDADGTVRFSDGSSKKFHAIILCTGYQHSFPFLAEDDSLRLVTRNRLYPPGLYRGVVWEKNPRLLYLSMQDQYFTFTHFDLMAWYARDVILGLAEVPGPEEMTAHTRTWVEREEKLADCHQEIDFQADHLKELAAATDYPKFDIDGVSAVFKEWEHDKEVSILGYRDKPFVSPITGTKGRVHHTKWIEAMDSSLEEFLRKD